jgi:hypothetical protein
MSLSVAFHGFEELCEKLTTSEGLLIASLVCERVGLGVVAVEGLLAKDTVPWFLYAQADVTSTIKNKSSAIA